MSAPQPARGSGARIEIRGLAKRYGGFEAVRGIDLEVPPGEIFALLGPNGAGKTTTIRMLMGILEPSAGTARIGGLDCFRQRAEVMRLVGYLPDEPVFYDYLKGQEILQFVGEMHGLTRAETALRAGSLLERLALRDAAEDFAVNYSKGMKKKLALICALIHEPSILILDEPSGGLDVATARTLLDLVREHAARGGTALFSTHVLEQAEKLCHRVGIIHGGVLAAEGTLGTLRASLAPGGSLEEVYLAVTEGTNGDAAPERATARPETGGG